MVDTLQLLGGIGGVAVLLAGIVFVVKGKKAKDEPTSAVAIVNKKDKVVKSRPQEDEDLHVKVLFGSQTGTAESFANRFVKEAKEHGLKAKAVDLEEFEIDFIAQEKNLVFLVATYGEGEPTDNAVKFHEWILEGGHDVTGMSYSVFGLGNRQYEHFNAMGKLVDEKLQEFGGKRITPVGLGDDDGTLEDDFESWKDRLWTPLRLSCGLTAKQEAVKAAKTESKFKIVEHEGAEVKVVPENPESMEGHKLHYATVTAVRELHGEASGRSCMHIELDMDGYDIQYHTGDHLGIFAPNPAELVEKAGRLMKFDLDGVFSLELRDGTAAKKPHFPQPVTFRRALTSFVDLTMPVRKSLLKTLSEFATNQDEAKKLATYGSKEGKAAFEKDIAAAEKTILDILSDFPSIDLPKDLFFELCPRLPARFYSISSSSSLYASTIHITCSVVDYNKSSGQHYRGVCSGWLQDNLLQSSHANMKVPCYVRHSTFRLPENPSTPVVMVGPGTGLAPLRGFIQERRFQKDSGSTVGETVLYFGCQHRDKDYIYKEELLEACNEGTLSALHLAFSREKEKKVYVQDLIRENADDVWRLLQAGCHFYVCGAMKMAKDVKKAVTEIAATNGKMSGNEAEAFVHKMVEEGAYQQDAW